MGLAIPRPTRLGDPRSNVRITHASKSCGIILIMGEPAQWRRRQANPIFKKVIKRTYLLILSLNLKDSNEIFRRAIIKAYFEPELQKMDYRKSSAKHPLITEDGLTAGQDVLHLFFDLITGNDYPDGDEWFTIEYLLPYSIKLPDKLKGPDYFTTIMTSEEKHFWRHRELIRFKYGKSKKLSESLEFMNRKYLELVKALHDSSAINDLK
jgi:hypothetical protein